MIQIALGFAWLVVAAFSEGDVNNMATICATVWFASYFAGSQRR